MKEELHSFGWYAARVSPNLPKKAFKPVPLRLLGGLAYMVVIAACFTAIIAGELHPLINIAISFVIGFCFSAIGFLGHEILHGTVVRKPWLRDLLGAIFMLPISTGPQLWRKWHNLTHHVHTQDADKDPDAWPNMEQLSRIRLLQWMYKLPQTIRAFLAFSLLTVTFTIHSTKQFTSNVKGLKPKKKAVFWFQFIFPWAVWFALLFVIGFTKWFYVFLLPLLITNFIVMLYISTNHRLNPLTEVNDPLANSLTVTMPKWVDVLHFNFSYHTEHHLFPGMSSKYYPLVKAEIKKMWPERYHEMPMHLAVKALWKTPRIYYKDTELIDPRKGKVYGSLGNGLDPKNITSRSENLEQLEMNPELAASKRK
jgi:fatty acid desaturase